jgi:hypothetical protein
MRKKVVNVQLCKGILCEGHLDLTQFKFNESLTFDEQKII